MLSSRLMSSLEKVSLGPIGMSLLSQKVDVNELENSRLPRTQPRRFIDGGKNGPRRGGNTTADGR